MTQTNVNPQEIANFSRLAQEWWDQNGKFKVLHDVNPTRLAFIEQHTDLKGKQVLDVGCGGGILAEALAKCGATVTAIDLSTASIAIAKQHAQDNDLVIDYQEIPIEDLATTQPEQYDIITCMEMLEHVPDPKSIIQACAQLTKPGGHLFFSTLNRTLRAYLVAIIGAEYLTNLIPKHTHDYEQFIRPSELASWVYAANLSVNTVRGINYNPLTRSACLSHNVQVNYLLYCQK